MNDKLKMRLIKKVYGTNDPKTVTFRTIDNLIRTSVGNFIDKKEMVEYLKSKISDLE